MPEIKTYTNFEGTYPSQKSQNAEVAPSKVKIL